MAIIRIPTTMLSAAALAEHVTTNMGLDVRPNMGVAAILAKMSQAGFPTDVIEIDDGREEQAVVKRKEPKRGRHIPNKRMVQLRIEPQERPGGSEPVFVSVNGVAIYIPRAKVCWVDFKYYEVLRNAVAHHAITDEESKIIGWRKVPEYPVSVFHIEPRLTAEEKQAAEAEAAKAAELAANRERVEDDEEVFGYRAEEEDAA
jgi:hypothetical protein